MKVLTQTEEEEHYQSVIKGGTRWGSCGLATGLTGALIANRYWSGFRNLTLPLKAFAVTSIGTFSLMIGADRASRSFEENQHNQLDHFDDDRWKDLNLENSLLHSNNSNNHSLSLSPRDQFLAQLKENQFKIVLAGWAASMVGSFGLVAAQPMPFTQKLIQARMYAQTLTVAMIIASAGLASFSNSEPKNLSSDQDPRTNSIYKFKKGSPHDLREKELRENKLRDY